KEQIKAEFEAFRNESKGKGFDKDFYRELSETKKEALKSTLNEQELKKILDKISQKHTKKGLLGEKINYEEVAKEQQEIIINQQEKIKTLSECLDYEIETRNEIIEDYTKKIDEDFKAKNQDMEIYYRDLVEKNIKDFEEAKEKVKDYKKSLDEEYKKKNQDLEAKYQEKINKLSLDSIVQKLKKEAIEVIDNLKN
ncbi:hypothetical protein, partial [Campylobacter fetus]|uniref:hypothetical protein n=3 Tax=Campylobacter fetus TaxID=196 RepID=UPI00130115BB